MHKNIAKLVVLGLVLMIGCTPRDKGVTPVADGKGGAKPDKTSATTTKKPTAPVTEPTPATNNRVRFAMCSNGLSREFMWKCDPIIADVNKDGFMDLAGNPRLGHGPQVWFGDGQGNWTPASSGLELGVSSCGGGLGFADFNKDSHLDLAVGDHCQGIYVFLGDGTGHWQMVTRGLFPIELAANHKGDALTHAGAEDLDVADFDGDGFEDLIASASDSGGINIYYGDGTGVNWRWADATDLPQAGWANRVVASDINKDGKTDVVASMGEGLRVYLNNGKGQFVASHEGLPTLLLQGLFQGVATGDINGDGRVDLAAANWVDGPEIFLQQADGSWKKGPIVFPQMEGGSYGIALGDLDQDGHLDIVSSGRLDKGQKGAGYVRGVFALMGDGQGNFSYAKGSGLFDTGMSFNWGVSVGDLNGDKQPDVIAGTGGVVESTQGRQEPIVPEKLIVFCSKPVSSK